MGRPTAAAGHPPTRVLKLVLAYDGSGFRGFARQPRQRTVQGTLEQALERVLGATPRLSVAGRTDAGVHAEGQVVSFEAAHDPLRLQRAVNSLVGPEVVVRSASRAPPGFDARRSATSRRYRYRLRTGQWPDPFTARYEWHRPGELSVGRMRRAARLLVGEHDFASFCRAPTGGASTIRSLRRLTVRPSRGVIEIWAEADAFLHQMVRSLVGTLVKVGEGRMELDGMPAILAARSRSAAGPVAPPDGLCLVAVRYGAIPKRRERSRTSGARR